MRIIVAHNRYKYAGGEDSSMEAEVEMLRLAGHEVRLLEADNATVQGIYSRISAAGSLFHSASSYRAMAELVQEFDPDLVHIHNWFPLLSPSIISAAVEAGVPVVQTLQNFRMVCANGTLYRGGSICEECVGKRFPTGAAVHGCYRESHVGSALVAAAFAYHREAKTWDGVARFIALSEFQRDLLVRGGIDPGRIAVKPHFVPDAGAPGEGRGGYAVFAGRLTEEKGIRTALRAWESGDVPVPLKILGDGPLREEVCLAAARSPHIEYLGQLPRQEVTAAMREAVFTVFASEWYEPFGLTIVEALSCGTPVLAADRESIHHLMRDGETGYTFAAGDAVDLALHAGRLLRDPEVLRAMRRRCRAVYEARYTEKTNYGQLMTIYNEAIASSPFARRSSSYEGRSHDNENHHPAHQFGG